MARKILNPGKFLNQPDAQETQEALQYFAAPPGLANKIIARYFERMRQRLPEALAMWYGQCVEQQQVKAYKHNQKQDKKTMSTETTQPGQGLHHLRIKYLSRVLRPLVWVWEPNNGWPRSVATTPLGQYIAQANAPGWTAPAFNVQLKQHGTTQILWKHTDLKTEEEARELAWLHYMEAMSEGLR